MHIIKLWRLIYKLVIGIFIVLISFLGASLIFIFPFNKYKRKRVLGGLYGFICFLFLKALNIKTNLISNCNYSEKKTYYIMSNHVSFIDIIIILAKFKTVFITSLEMKKRFLLGQICVMSGSVFVDRRKITTLKDEIPEITGALKNNVNVCLFPESTCANGMELLPFKAALMSAVSNTPAEILPLSTMYRKINSRSFAPQDFSEIGYFGGMRFVPQFIKLLTLKSLEVDLEILDPFAPENLDRKDMRDKVYDIISKRYYRYIEDIKKL
ncbi:MAG: 1-acyl-sn-glycerol-3-phosphate acyltransferase [Spirochaetaceae bacterium]|nr:1-acyl-sn-glycerol-3-phosphate acyltransferase [Spirochaetaceae bacterium]